MAEDPNVKILNRCHIAPPPGSVSSTSLPLTFFDVLWLSVIPMERLFFYQYPYPTHHFIQTILPTLTHSLSVTLKYFFPFAANLICPPQPRKPHILYVDGDSLALTVAESAAEFNHLISDHPRDVKALHPLTPKLLSARVLEDGSLALPLMAIQVTIFPDSGFSIGVIFNHVAADGRSFHHFMKSWASICRNGGTCLEEPEPFHNRAEIRDPNELELNFLNWWWNYGAPKLKVDSGLTHFSFTDKVRATIVLSRAQIQKLKHWFELAQTHSLSTFVATCSLIWVCMVKSEESVIGISGDDKLCYIIFSADCRNRYELSIPSTYFGNCLAFCYVPLKRKEVVGELGLVEAAKAIGNKVKELERGALKGAERWMQMGKEIVGHHTVIVAASPKFNVYQTDFGWGKLKKSEVVHIDKLGIISLAEGRDEEGGIEVGLALPQAQMNKFSAILRECLELLTILQPQATMAGHNSELNFLKNFRIPNYILVPETKVESNHDAPTCPVLVFINSKSGGQLGGDLLKTYRNLLNEKQVFDLGEEAPDKVLRRIYANLEILKLQGDQFAIGTMEKLKLIVAGGDGTAGWLLGVVCDLKLSHPPPIVTVPLGTGNNLPFAFGWGKKNPGTDQSSVESFLSQVIKAKEMKIDNWHILMRMRAPKEGSCDPIAPLELPHSLHAFHRVSEADELNMEGYHTFHGGFWNYFSMGMDAQVSYAFHSERKMHPEKFKNQLVNQSTYAKLGCTQGWFFAHLTHPPSRNIAHIAKVKIMKRDGEWKDLHIPSCIRSIICLNLPSFSGGLNPWGTPNGKKRNERDLTPPFVDDGLLEVVGFRDAWHGLVLLAPNGHGTRLAQANRIRFEFHKGAADHTYMRIDGEPWKQPLPVDDDTVVVEISHLGQVNILATHDCRSKSVRDQSTSDHDVEEDDSADEDTAVEDFRKFGAADTFRIPDEVDLSHLS